MTAAEVDFHNHLMPGVDDGARDVDESRDALRALAEAGISTLVATVHVDASEMDAPARWRKRLDEIDGGYERLDELARAEFPSLRLTRGAEIKLDSDRVDLGADDIRLAGTRFALVEFARFEAPPFAEPMLRQVRGAGCIPVLAHPERYRGASDIVQSAREWRSAGALLQMNHGSLLGRYGSEVRAAAWRLLDAGLITYLSSDYHASGGTWIPETRDALVNAENGTEALELLRLNARRLLDDEEPLPVAPVHRRGLARRVRELL